MIRFLLLTCLVGCANYSTADKVVTGTFVASIAVDWYQTNEALDNCDSYYEANPILGKCGEKVPTYIYFPVTTALILTGSHFLPQKWRSAALGLITGFQANTVYHNFKIMD